MKKPMMIALAASLLLALTACGPTGPAAELVTEDPTASPEVTATAEASASPSLEPTPSPAASDGDKETVTTYAPSDAGFDDLYSQADIVVLGTVMDEGKEWNQIRDLNDLSKESTEIFEMDMSYKFQVDECLKGSYKKGDTIQYNLYYRSKGRNDKDFTMISTFLAPVKGNQYLIFVKRDPSFDNIYYSDVEPHCFELKSDKKIYLYINDKKLEGWGGQAMAAGIEYGSAKAEMGVGAAAASPSASAAATKKP
ncbi:MAG: hypothetical protein LBU47_01170 [Christensenellaceae bacterium]|jgi:predicted small lipoprotein YifL|nr:hypothetical protein [Christensenellaceae bacterium]